MLKDRDIDAEIKMIQERIKRAEEEKKKLNIACSEWKDAELPKRVFSHSKVS